MLTPNPELNDLLMLGIEALGGATAPLDQTQRQKILREIRVKAAFAADAARLTEPGAVELLESGKPFVTTIANIDPDEYTNLLGGRDIATKILVLFALLKAAEGESQKAGK